MLLNTMDILNERIDFKTDTAADRGTFLVAKSSENAWDGDNWATVAASPSGYVGKVIGMLKWNAVELSTRQLLNDFKGDQRVDHKVTLVDKGVVQTNLVSGTPAVGGTAYLGASGYVCTLSVASGYGTPGTDVPAVGRFESAKDTNDYVKLRIDI